MCVHVCACICVYMCVCAYMLCVCVHLFGGQKSIVGLFQLLPIFFPPREGFSLVNLPHEAGRLVSPRVLIP